MGIAGAALMLLAVTMAVSLKPAEDKSGRVHQHLTARRDTGCSCDGSELCSHLPLVIIDTRGQEIPGDLTGVNDSFDHSTYTTADDGSPTIVAEVRVIDNRNRNNHPSDEPDFITESEFRFRGQSSRHYEKKPYLLKFLDGEGERRKIPVMGMAAHFEWALHSPLIDKSLVRNYMWYNISGELMDYAPDCRFCEVIVNREYRGVYLMVETVTAGDNCRLNLKMNVKNSRVAGYMLRLDRPSDAELESLRDIYAYAERINRVLQDVTIRYPGKSMLTEEMKEYIERDYAAFEKSLYSFDYNTKQYGYQNWIDVDNFAVYYIIQEFVRNCDMGAFSTYLYREPGEPYRLCIWDMDHVLDMDEDFILTEQAWYLMLFKDEAFVQRVLERYSELRKSWLSEEFLVNYLEETVAYLGAAAERNNVRWQEEISSVLALNIDAAYSFEEAVGFLKERMIQRGRWMDETIHSLRQYCHPSRNKKYSH